MSGMCQFLCSKSVTLWRKRVTFTTQKVTHALQRWLMAQMKAYMTLPLSAYVPYG